MKEQRYYGLYCADNLSSLNLDSHPAFSRWARFDAVLDRIKKDRRIHGDYDPFFYTNAIKVLASVLPRKGE